MSGITAFAIVRVGEVQFDPDARKRFFVDVEAGTEYRKRFRSNAPERALAKARACASQIRAAQEQLRVLDRSRLLGSAPVPDGTP